MIYFDVIETQAHLKDPALLERWFDELKRTIAIDFDGVLHPYTNGWTGSVPDDEPPIDGARELLAELHGTGFLLVVFSTRADHTDGKLGILDWLERHELGQYIEEVTHLKVPAIAYIDDRAVPYAGNWDEVRAGVARLAAGAAHGAGAVQPGIAADYAESAE